MDSERRGRQGSGRRGREEVGHIPPSHSPAPQPPLAPLPACRSFSQILCISHCVQHVEGPLGPQVRAEEQRSVILGVCVCLCGPHLGSGLYMSWLPRWLSGKESACNARPAGDIGLIPGPRRSPGGGHGKSFQYPCLENPVDRGAWQATVHRVTKSWTRLK